jgi:hypothetical protein
MSRLSQNNFVQGNLVDFSGPVIRLSSLTPEDFYVLLHKIREVYASGDEAKFLLPEEGIKGFMEHCSKRIGNTYFRTPRTTITSFINLLAIIEQNEGTNWQELLGTVEVVPDTGGANDLKVDTDMDEFATFKM